MRKVVLFLLIFSTQCYSQENYQLTLQKRLEEIMMFDIFDNSVVVYDDSSSYGSTFPTWDPKTEFIQDDIVAFSRGRLYRASVDNNGKNPLSSPNEWKLMHRRPLPYLFLRDTARIDDLKRLLKFDHPYIRIYAFAALAHRNSDNLFDIVVDNLKDTTRVEQMTSDYGYTLCPADLMLWYSAQTFTKAQKDIIGKLILTKYQHLKTLEEVLFFHRPSDEHYPFVKDIVTRDPKNKFALVALSKYCKDADTKALAEGFTLDIYSVYYAGYKIFFNAIENCPNKSFKHALISCKIKEMHEGLWVDEYYVRALASYKDKDCLDVIKELAQLNSSFAMDNQAIIYRALKAHYSPMYDALMTEIKNNLHGQDSDEIHPNDVDNSPWNY